MIKQVTLLLLFFAVSSQISAAQDWENPAEQYRDAYKAYLLATCPIPADNIQHFVYFSKDRKKIINHAFLANAQFQGAQIMYSWKELEPRKGRYDFSMVEKDLNYLKKHGKKLFVQLQDVTFYPKYKAVPNYLLSDVYDGGVVAQYYADGQPGGWVAKRWSEKVRVEFARFLQAFGEAFDGKIEGINLQETAIEIGEDPGDGFTEEKYVAGLKANMLALKKAFPTSTTMQYANFVPGEWLPWDDKGYLSSIYAYGQEIGVGLGAPDLMVQRKAQLNHPLRFMHEGDYSVPIGIAIQDGNYAGQTGADLDYSEQSDKARNNIVPLLHAFAKDFLKVNYIFWVNQPPYFEEDVLTCFVD
ncbi:MAG: hypothetical protein AAF564_02450 [Bacteroidota bacterium]